MTATEKRWWKRFKDVLLNLSVVRTERITSMSKEPDKTAAITTAEELVEYLFTCKTTETGATLVLKRGGAQSRTLGYLSKANVTVKVNELVFSVRDEHRAAAQKILGGCRFYEGGNGTSVESALERNKVYSPETAAAKALLLLREIAKES